ncbi:phage tail sheath C-terminal domain-containing protein [Mucilaginibacter sp.]|uniref:phage tail sheath family protein n=1 Tax=Mucilaginibacter sp. TaxID=1882438 RepID=UPI00262F721E|nr:phage tail sheath C-terminal domain-containing protein [Mucilaginibacter sp.]MDB4918388.1 hypothetical protein [Mucilaginibacter sp.]
MTNYYTPGVYVEEISTLPPSVVEGSTAIPAFLGYTKKTEYNGTDRKLVPTRISTMLEFLQYFGGPPTSVVSAKAKVISATQTIFDGITDYKSSIYKLYYSLDLFFKNGGNYCYIVSLGVYSSATEFENDDFEEGLKSLEKEDEPTLIVMPDACGLSQVNYYAICQEALAQCQRLKNRFCILDVRPADVETADAVEIFRDHIGAENLQYGAAYFPFLKTSISPVVDDINITVKGLSGTGDSGGTKKDTDKAKAAEAKAKATAEAAATATAAAAAAAATAAADVTPEATAAAEVAAAAAIEATAAAVTAAAEAKAAAAATETTTGDVTLYTVKTKYTGLYSAIRNELNSPKYKVVLPASAAIAGVYASVDRDRGVWKAPANVGLNSVIEPVTKITVAEQDKLNVHADGGKSINAIRSFTGKGIIVWGARTLAGNDNEWRYVSVRRLFNLIEDSASKATFFAVFEPNDATTWLKVQSMIDSYLYSLWQQGALAGSTAKAAYFVKVGLGSTMTTQDILEGRMIIEIGVAAVRPAEFIILRFSHKLQEA